MALGGPEADASPDRAVEGVHATGACDGVAARARLPAEVPDRRPGAAVGSTAMKLYVRCAGTWGGLLGGSCTAGC